MKDIRGTTFLSLYKKYEGQKSIQDSILKEYLKLLRVIEDHWAINIPGLEKTKIHLEWSVIDRNIGHLYRYKMNDLEFVFHADNILISAETGEYFLIDPY